MFDMFKIVGMTAIDVVNRIKATALTVKMKCMTKVKDRKIYSI